MMTQRIVPLMKSYFSQLPEIHVFTDKINKSFPIYQYKHSNMTIHETNIENHLIVGSFAEKNGWEQSQNRHLQHLAELYETCPNKEWYVAADDDTYLFPESLSILLSNYNSSEISVICFPFFASAYPSQFFDFPEKPHFFPHGGSGICISKAAMKLVYPSLRKCNLIFHSIGFPSDVRLARCFDYVTNFYFTFDNLYIYSHSLFENHPDLAEPNYPYFEPPASYHNINPEMIEHMKFASVTDINSTHYIDWYETAFEEFLVDIDTIHLRIMNGYRIYDDWNSTFNDVIDITRNGRRIHPLTQKEPIYEDGKIVAFQQDYENFLKIVYICDENLSEREIAFSGVGDISREDTIELAVRCPLPKKYFVNNNEKTPIRIIQTFPDPTE